MDFMELAEKRHSVRAYKSTPVENEKLGKILQAARLAPTACNLQAFKIIVILTKGREEELKQIYGRDWFVAPPYILCICTLTEKCWVRRRDGKSYGDVDSAIVMDHIILAAAEQGLGTCWIGAFDAEAAKRILELDASMEPVAFTPLGYAKDEYTTSKTRKPLEELVVYK